jgi:hypothetical protein
VTLVAERPVPYIRLTLDTRAPTLVVTATGRVAPPDSWPVAVTASEAIGDADLALTDSLGVEHSVGYARLGDQVLSLLVPTVGLPTGPATLVGWVSDLAGNRSPISQPVVIDRPKVWDATLAFERAFDAAAALADAYDATLGLGHAYAATEEHTPAWDVTLADEHGYDATLEHTNGQ